MVVELDIAHVDQPGLVLNDAAILKNSTELAKHSHVFWAAYQIGSSS